MDHVAGISAYNWIDQPGESIDQPGVVLTADTEALDGKVDNVTTYEAGVPWIAVNLSLSGGVCNMTAVFARPREVGCLGFLIAERRDDATNIDFEPYVAPEDRVRWRFSSDPDPAVNTGDLWDSADLSGADGAGRIACGVDPTLGVHGLLPPKTIGVRRVDFQFAKDTIPAAPRDIARFGRLWAGPFRSFETNHDWGAETGWDEDELRHDVRVWAAPFNWIPDAVENADHIAYAYLKTVSQQVSTDRQVFFWPRTDQPSEAMFMRFANRSRFRSKFMTNMSTGAVGKVSSWSPSLKEDWLGV